MSSRGSCGGSMSALGDAGQGTYEEYDFAVKKYGREGREVPIYANFFNIKVNSRIIYHYNIDIQVQDFIREQGDKNVPQRNRLLQQKRLFNDCNYAIFERLIKQETGLFGSEPVFDGRKNVYSKTKINMPEKTITVQVKHKVPEKRYPITFNVTLTTPKDSHELDMSILKDKDLQKAEKEIQALDIILQYGPRRYKLAVGSNMFMRQEDLAELPAQQRDNIRFPLGEMKEVSFGHYQSCKLTETGTQLNVDRVAIVFLQGGKLINLIEKLCTEMRSGPQRRDGPPPRAVVVDRNFRLNTNERYLLNQELKGLSFEVEHISYRPRNKIFCITDKTVSEIFFEQRSRDSENTVQVSVKEYFEKVYVDYLERAGLQGLNGNLPCIQVGKTNPRYFPAEVCSIVYDQYMSKKLKPKHQAIMTTRCGQQKPTERFEESKLQVQSLIRPKSEEKDYLDYFDIQMENNYTQVKGRVLDPAKLLCQNNKTNVPREGQWRPDDGYVIPSKDIAANWMVINFTKDYNNEIRFAPKKDQVDAFISTLLTCARNMGLNMQRPCDVVYNEVYRGRRDLEDMLADYLQDHKELKLIILFIPKLDELYSNIKFVSETQIGVVTQCVSQEKSRQFAQMSYVSNLMLKINAKLGGSNFHLEPSCKVGFLKKKTMIMGVDVTHPSKFDRLGNSIASVVGSFDSKMVNYFAKCVVQPKPRLEVVQLDEITKELLENFNKKNKFYPDFILVYRDGVSDGQFNEVIDKEINLMKKAFVDIGPNYAPKITFLVVQKRHHTRFLAVNERDRLRSQNVLPGTIIDNTIVSNYYFDFYLCAHFGALGTSRPARYVCLHDESGFSGDEIQKTTYLLSHLYPRCCKTTSIVPPVLYAHLSAKRARSYLFTLDDNRGQTFGELELTPAEIKELNKKIEVKPSLQNILYYV